MKWLEWSKRVALRGGIAFSGGVWPVKKNKSEGHNSSYGRFRHKALYCGIKTGCASFALLYSFLFILFCCFLDLIVLFQSSLFQCLSFASTNTHNLQQPYTHTLTLNHPQMLSNLRQLLVWFCFKCRRRPTQIELPSF